LCVPTSRPRKIGEGRLIVKVHSPQSIAVVLDQSFFGLRTMDYGLAELYFSPRWKESRNRCASLEEINSFEPATTTWYMRFLTMYTRTTAIPLPGTSR